ncbi:MAG: NuoM family protein, partial [Acidimicrobiia bacterium]
MPVLSILILLPLVGAVVVGLLPTRRSELVYPIALGMSIPPLAVALYILWNFTAGDAAFQFAENIALIESFGISWTLAVDGISLFMVVLTALLFPISIAASHSITDRAKSYMVLMLILETGVLGVFLALDLFVFFAFFEVVLIPMYMLISMWGSENRAYASLKFVLFTAVGSAFLLASIIALGVLTGEQLGTVANFDFRNMLQVELSSTAELALFVGFGVAFAIKVP